MLPRYEDALAVLAQRLDASDVAHCERTARTAWRIAEAYAVDARKAQVAGVLHDLARAESPEELVRQARRRGIEVTAVDRAVPYLLHAPVGAALARELFEGIDEDVIHAIACHTVGDAHMSDLDMVVYVADAVEPGRTHASAARLRSAIGTVPLHELYVRTYAASMEHLVESRRPIHPRTLDAWNAIAGGLR